MHKYINEQDAIETDQLVNKLKESDHFYITHYCKKREQIEERRCYWDSKSKIWETKQGKLAITCVALNDETYEIDGYRTFTDIFTVTGRRAIHTSEAIQ